MSEERFEKIEQDKVRSGFVEKPKEKEKDRFSRIELDGKPREEEKASGEEKKGIGLFPCPRCNRGNKKSNTYCSWCGYLFPEKIQKTESELEPYQILCPQCSHVCHKTQKTCLFCGYHLIPTTEDILRTGGVVEVEISGTKYSSTDPYLPKHIKESLVKIKQGSHSPEEIAKIAKEIQIENAEVKMKVQGVAERNKNRAKGSAFIGGAALMFLLARIMAQGLLIHATTLFFIVTVVAYVAALALLIAGITFLAFGFSKSEVDQLPPPGIWG